MQHRNQKCSPDCIGCDWDCLELAKILQASFSSGVKQSLTAALRRPVLSRSIDVLAASLTATESFSAIAFRSVAAICLTNSASNFGSDSVGAIRSGFGSPGSGAIGLLVI